MITNLKTIFEKYNFDYIFIHPKNINDLDFEYVAEEIVIDNKSEYYLGTIKINEVRIKVFWDKKITPNDVIFKYKDIKKERNIKLNNLFS